jgi:hypothetical protein
MDLAMGEVGVFVGDGAVRITDPDEPVKGGVGVVFPAEKPEIKIPTIGGKK